MTLFTLIIFLSLSILSRATHTCNGKEDCSDSTISCADNWPCGYDCLGCPICDESGRVFFNGFIETSEVAMACCGKSDQASRCILCPEGSLCETDCMNDPICGEESAAISSIAANNFLGLGTTSISCCGKSNCGSICVPCPSNYKCTVDPNSECPYCNQT